MTKFYAPALALVLIGADANAQSLQGSALSKQYNGLTRVQRDRTAPNQASILRDAFWTEDFSGGSIPSGWLTTDDSTAAPTPPVVFTWSNNPSAVGVAVGSFPEYGEFEAPGASNGYLWANSDRDLTAAPSSRHMTRLTTTAIDCSVQSSVMFSMQSVIGVFQLNADTNVRVRVSTDGLTWTDFFPYPNLVTGASAPPNTRWTYNPQLVYLDISSVAAFQPEVYIQLAWRGRWEYYWGIDDLALSAVPDYEISLDHAFISTFGDPGGQGELEYGRIPASQLPGTLNFGASLYNFGLGEQTNVELHVDFEDEAGVPVAGFSGSTSVGSIPYGESADAFGTLNIPSGLAPGVYFAKFTLTGDAVDQDGLNPDDNSATRFFEVTSDVYSLDAIGLQPEDESLDYAGTFSFTDNSELHFMTMYNVNSTMTVTGLYVQLATGTISLTDGSGSGGMTVPGDGSAEMEGFINGNVSAIVTGGAGMTDPILEAVNGARSDIHIVNAGDVTRGTVALVFDPPVTLSPGTYYAGVRLKGSGTVSTGTLNDAEVSILDDATVPQPIWASAIYLPNDTDPSSGTERRHSYINGNAYAIRMTTSPSVGVRESAELAGINLFPNPTDGLFQVTSDRTEVLFVEVTDALGHIVHTSSFNGTGTIDLSKVAAGVYNVEVSSRTERSVHRISVR